jgi:predicted  nucleic acid-binding Zn-ribbon protein
MAIPKPIAVYNAEHNIEAQLLCDHLERNGVEAHATLDESVVGMWAFGRLPEIHKTQVWVDQSNVELAAELLAEYERQRSRRHSRPVADQNADTTVGVLCEECGKKTLFPVSKRGTVQDCEHCGAYVDVEDGPESASDIEFQGEE